MNIDQYKLRDVRRYVIRCWELYKCNICEPPEGTYFAWQHLKSIRWLGLYRIGGPVVLKNKIIMVAHNHTKRGDIWIAPIDATRQETAGNKYIITIRECLEKLILENK